MIHYGIFVNNNYPFASCIVRGLKTIETRNRNMLKRLVGKRVAIVRTETGEPTEIIGYVTITEAWHCSQEDFQLYEMFHLVPAGSKYDAGKNGKWMYDLEDARIALRRLQLPADTIRHGMSWVEFPTGIKEEDI